VKGENNTEQKKKDRGGLASPNAGASPPSTPGSDNGVGGKGGGPTRPTQGGENFVGHQ